MTGVQTCALPICLSKPLVSFVTTDTTVMERTACNFPWGFNIPVSISRAPAAVTNVKFTITGNTDGQDYTISPDSVSFSPTDTADKSFSNYKSRCGYGRA